MTTGSARPLEDAFRIAHAELVGWVARAHRPLAAWTPTSWSRRPSLTPVANVVDTSYTVVAKMPKRYLGAVTVMSGPHDRLRGT